jgi:hypothetical protein
MDTEKTNYNHSTERTNNSIIELKELVYAPLQAISDANLRLSTNIVEFLSSTGDLVTDKDGNLTAQLHSIQMQYKQLRTDVDDNTVADHIGLEVPLLSIYPLTSLKVSKTKVSFNLNVNNMKSEENSVKIYAQFCAKKQRQTANLASINFDVELESVPASEGLARFVDLLNANMTPKRIATEILDDEGYVLTGEKRKNYEDRIAILERETEINNKLNEIRKLLRSKNKALKTLTNGMDYDEYTENMNYGDKEQENAEITELCNSIKEYRSIRENLEEQLKEIQNEKMALIINDQEPEKKNEEK